MRPRAQRIVSLPLLALMLAPLPAAAQYYDYQPHKPDVEIDLSVLDDLDRAQGRVPDAPPPTAAMLRSVESAPLPPVTAIPLSQNARLPQAPAAYEHRRVVPRTMLDDSAPAMPSPYAAPLVKPAPAYASSEPQRTAPARPPLPKAPVDGGPPLMVQGEDLPPQNVTASVRGTPAPKSALVKPPASPPPPAAEDLLPVRKPEHIAVKQELAPDEEDDPAPADIAVAARVETAAPPPVPARKPDNLQLEIVEDEPVPDLPAEVAHTDREVIDDLYTLPPHEAEQAELSPVMRDTMPELVDDAPAPRLASAAAGMGDAATRHSLVFEGSATAFDAGMTATIDSAAAELEQNPARRLMIESYATGHDGSRAGARQLSLSRALSVRAHLMDIGIAPNRVDVRARGNELDDGAPDRVDLIITP